MYNLYECEDFRIDCEVDEFKNILLHSTFTNWSKSIARKYKDICSEMIEPLYLEGFAMAYTITPNPKFAKLVDGWQLIGNQKHNNKEYEVIAWDLQQLAMQRGQQ